MRLLVIAGISAAFLLPAMPASACEDEASISATATPVVAAVVSTVTTTTLSADAADKKPAKKAKKAKKTKKEKVEYMRAAPMK
jgi:hypothetical protein